MRISTDQVSCETQVEKVGNPKQKCENFERADNNQTECHEIEPNSSKDRGMHERENPLF